MISPVFFSRSINIIVGISNIFLTLICFCEADFRNVLFIVIETQINNRKKKNKLDKIPNKI